MTDTVRVACPHCRIIGEGATAKFRDGFCNFCCGQRDQILPLAPGERERIAREVVTERIVELRGTNAKRTCHGTFATMLGNMEVAAEWKAADILLAALFGPAKEASDG